MSCRRFRHCFSGNNQPPCLLHRRKHRQLRKFLHHRRGQRLNHIPDIKRRNPYRNHRHIIHFFPYSRHSARSIKRRNQRVSLLKRNPCFFRRNAPHWNLKPVALHIHRNVNNRNIKCRGSPYHRKSSRCRNNDDSVLEQLAPASRGNAAPLNTLRHKRGSRSQALDTLFPWRQLVYFHFNRRLCNKFNRRPFNRGSDHFNSFKPERQRPHSRRRREQGLHLDKRSLCRSIGNGFRRNNKPPCLLHRRKHRQLRKFLHHRRSKRLNHIPDFERRNPYCDNRNIIYFHPHPRNTSRSIFWRNKQQQFLKLGPCCIRRNAPHWNVKPVALHIHRNVNNRNVKCCRSPYHRKSSRCRNNNDSVLEQLAPPSRGNAAPLNTLRHKRWS